MENKFLQEGLIQLKIEPSADIIEKFSIYLQELKKWNRAYNLTSLKKDEDIIVRHFFDSLLYLEAVPEGRYSICDIGSGAGFPGVPIAIVRPEFEICLIEPSRKKTAFLRHIKRTLKLQNVEILEGRAEDIRDRMFDIGVTRALFSIGELIKKARHMLKKNGFFVLNKGPKFEEEIKEIPQEINIEVVSLVLPKTAIKRNIIKILLPS